MALSFRLHGVVPLYKSAIDSLRGETPGKSVSGPLNRLWGKANIFGFISPILAVPVKSHFQEEAATKNPFLFLEEMGLDNLQGHTAPPELMDIKVGRISGGIIANWEILSRRP
jgi:hypothetical protein